MNFLQGHPESFFSNTCWGIQLHVPQLNSPTSCSLPHFPVPLTRLRSRHHHLRPTLSCNCFAKQLFRPSPTKLLHSVLGIRMCLTGLLGMSWSRVEDGPMQRLLKAWWNKSYYAKDDNSAASLCLGKFQHVLHLSNTIFICTTPHFIQFELYQQKLLQNPPFLIKVRCRVAFNCCEEGVSLGYLHEIWDKLRFHGMFKVLCPISMPLSTHLSRSVLELKPRSG